MRAERLAALTLAALAAVLGFYLRVRLAASLPNFDPEDDTGYFHVEGAFQYRYAKLLAFGGEVPAVDKAAQWPEGVRVGREVSLLMERATALTHTLAGSPRPKDAFHGFVLLWICGVSASAALALYLLASRLSGDPPLAAACAFAYAASWLACSITAGTYGFQSFALPLLFFAMAGLTAALDESEPRRDAWAAGAAAVAAVALVSWHFSRFFLGTVWLALLWAGLRASADGRARAARATAWLCAGAALAGLMPVMTETRFLASPAFLLGPAVWAFLALERRKAAGVWAGLALLALASRSAESAAYGHVWSLFAAKLRFFLAKPDDPSRLPVDARLLWSGPFNSPELGLLVFSFAPLGLLAAGRALRGEDRAPEGRRLWDALALAYLLGSALVSRLTTPLAFLLCAAPAVRAPKGRARTLALWATLLVGGLEACKTLFPASPLNPMLALAAAVSGEEKRPTGSFDKEKELLVWLRQRGRGRPTAAGFGLSASLLAYGDVPVLIHPKFEAAGVRRKTAEYLTALYGSEDDLAGYCERYGARLLVYSADAVLDETKDGPRYMSGRKSLPEDSAAFKLHFAPKTLKKFKRLFENEDFRVYAVGASTEAAYGGEDDPIYDLAQFSSSRAADGSRSLDVQGALARRKDARLRVTLARIYVQMRLGERALAAYEEAFSLWPPTAELRDEQLRLRAALIKARP